MVKNKITKINFKEFNSKNRKGTYVYIKTKGKPGRYYKYNGHPYELDAIKEHHNKTQSKTTLKQRKERYTKVEKHITKRLPKGSSKQEQQLKRKLKKKAPKDHFIKGIQVIKLQNPTNLNNQQIKEATKILLQRLVLDKELLEILSQEQNLQKVKTRFHYQLDLKGEKGTLASANRFNATPQEAINDIKKNIQKGQEITYKTVQQQLPKWSTNYQMEGTLNTINLKITFRKG